MERLQIERADIEKNRRVFSALGYSIQDNPDSTFTLSDFMQRLARNLNLLKDMGSIGFPVIEEEFELEILNENQEINDEDEKELQTENQNNKRTRVSTREIPDTTRPLREGGFGAEESSGQGSLSKNQSSDALYEEGRRRVYKIKIFSLLWDESEAIAVVMDDITQQKIIMELKVADQNKDLVIATVSHELRTPLNGMLGLIDIARKEIDRPDTLAYLQACKNSGVLMLNLVNSILDMNQIKNKKLRLIFAKIQLKTFLKETLALFDYSCKIKQLSLNLEFDPKLSDFLITDIGRLSQILVNLLGNAFKFTFKGGVTLRAQLESKFPYQVRFSIQDTGIGISKEDQEKLFKMYGRVEQKDKKINTQGIGLGLTISNTLSKLLGPPENYGIQVESELEKGTCFSFVVQSQPPEKSSVRDVEDGTLEEISAGVFSEEKEFTILKKMNTYGSGNSRANEAKMGSSIKISRQLGEVAENEELSTAPEKKESAKEILQENQKIKESIQPWCLIVDDNPFNLMVACHIMEERRYQVRTALNGQDAIQQVKSLAEENKKLKVILMDCQMPVMDGYEATKIITAMMKEKKVAECPIFALTANNRDEEHEKKCKEIGMAGQISKPLQIAELETVMLKINKAKKL